VRDFRAAGTGALADLRSDQVAHRFFVTTSGVNVLVARMTVPGGPWPGHFGLEAAVFDAAPAEMPAAFPALAQCAPLRFGRLRGASRGLAAGSGAVLFPEQLAVRVRPARQSFGVVFLGKLAGLFTTGVLPVLDADLRGALRGDPGLVLEIRRLAFLAHEWGHLTGCAAEQGVAARGCRLIAVIAELHADLAALAMLDACPEPRAELIATVLVADRVVREAWLRRPYRQVDAIAARQLLVLLSGCGALEVTDDHRLRIDLSRAAGPAAGELARVREIEAACVLAGSEPAAAYLRERGWALLDTACHRELEDPLSRFLGYMSTRTAAV